MITVSIIGSGNVAQHLILAFKNANSISLLQVMARDKNKVISLVETSKIISQYDQLQEADLYIIAVSDDAIEEVATQIPFQNKLVVHTSGSIPMTALASHNRSGVFYPLQTFSKGKSIDFRSVPICIESTAAEDLHLIEKVAKTLSDEVYSLNSEQRKALHVAAVFVNNFTNHLYKIGADICQEHNLPFAILKPLIRETAEKVMTLSPIEAQTGPAKRNDHLTIEAHLALLKDENRKKIYTLLTQSIQNHD